MSWWWVLGCHRSTFQWHPPHTLTRYTVSAYPADTCLLFTRHNCRFAFEWPRSLGASLHLHRFTVVVNIVGVIAVVGKSAEARPIQVDGERIMWSHQHVDAHIEFLMTDEKRVVDIPLNYICFGLIVSVWPLRYLAYCSKEKYPFALASSNLNLFRITGFIIQTTFWSLLRLNSSRKIGYSLGRL